MKLTDTQLVLLSAASQRDDRAVELPSNLKGGAAQKVIDKLLREGLVEGNRARTGMPVWRRNEDARPIALQVTKQGLAAIGIEDESLGSSLRSTPAAVGARAKQAKTKKITKQQQPGRPKRNVSKQSSVITLLSRSQGASIATIMKATGWQQHSVRGFFAAVVRKKLGLKLQSEKTAGQRVYRIVNRKRAAA